MKIEFNIFVRNQSVTM